MWFVELSSFLIHIKSSDSDIEKPRLWSELQNMHITGASEANNNGKYCKTIKCVPHATVKMCSNIMSM